MRKRRYGRIVSMVLAAVTAGCILAGCGSQTGGTQSSQSTGSAAASSDQTAQRKQKDTLVVAKSEDVSSLDPAQIVNQKSFTVYDQIFEGLVKLNPETKEVEPCLATEWEQIDDLNWHFTLRQGVKFHDGSEMKAEDVVYSFERIMNSGVVSSYVDYIDKIVADGDYAVTMTIKMPYAQIIQALTYPAAVVVSKAAAEASGDAFGQNPIGTGPYAFSERFEADSITLVGFDDYWGEKAKTKNLIFKVIPEGSQRTIMLENGEADIICDVPSNDASRIGSDDNLKLYNETGNKYYAIYFKADSKTPAGDKRIRQAVEYAIDKQALADAVFAGYAQVGSLLCTPATAGYNAAKDRGNVYDTAKAKELMSEAGYPDGFDIDIYVRTGQVYEEIATIIQAQLAEVGINANIILLESTKITEKLYGGEEVPMNIGFYNNICGDTDFIMQKLLPATYGQNYFNDEMIDLINRSRAETDPAKRQAVYDEFFDLMAEDMPQLSLLYEQILVGTSKNVEGFYINPLGAHQYSTVVVYED